MGSVGQLLGWAEKLTQPLTGFEGQTSPLDTIYHQATQQFQQSASTLLGPTSGPAAFQGDTATKMRSAVQDIQQVERQLQNLQVLVNAAKACAKAVQDDLTAMESTAPRMIDIPTALMLMAAVGVVLAAQEGQSAIPAAIINGLQVAMTIARADLAAAMASVPPDPPAVEAAQQALTKAENALHTLQAFMTLAGDLKNDISQWTNAINGIASGITPPQQNGFFGQLKNLGGEIENLVKSILPAGLFQKLHLSSVSTLTNAVNTNQPMQKALQAPTAKITQASNLVSPNRVFNNISKTATSHTVRGRHIARLHAHHAPVHHAPVHHTPVHHTPVHHAPVHPLPAMHLSTSQYVGIARRDAINAGIPPDYFVRQIQQESSFNPNAVSSAGAIGIAQFEPSTAAGLGLNPHDPIASLNTAAHYMASQAHSYGGDYAKALAAYNAGPGAVNRAVTVGGTNWLTHMPAETQNYVHKIMGQ